MFFIIILGQIPDQGLKRTFSIEHIQLCFSKHNGLKLSQTQLKIKES